MLHYVAICETVKEYFNQLDWKRFESKESNMSKGGMANNEILEFDDSEVVAPDFDPPAKMGDPSIEVTEKNRERAQELKSLAMDAVLGVPGNLNEAINHLTEAIILNPKSALLYASRASVFIKLKKPNAAKRDAEAALLIDFRLAKAYKALGMSRALLGLWDTAASELHEAAKLDFDEETSTWLKRVQASAKKAAEQWENHEQLRNEKEMKKAEIERLRLAQEAEFASVLKDGQVIVIESASELGIKLNAASELSRLAIVYFTANWWASCRDVAPIYAELAAKYPKVVFLKVDIDEVIEAAAKWNISSIPSFYFSQGGRVVDEVLDINLRSLEMKIAHYAA